MPRRASGRAHHPAGEVSSGNPLHLHLRLEAGSDGRGVRLRHGDVRAHRVRLRRCGTGCPPTLRRDAAARDRRARRTGRGDQRADVDVARRDDAGERRVDARVLARLRRGAARSPPRRRCSPPPHRTPRASGRAPGRSPRCRRASCVHRARSARASRSAARVCATCACACCTFCSSSGASISASTSPACTTLPMSAFQRFT